MRVVPSPAPCTLPPLHGVGLAKARQSPWDAEVRRLFSLFDFRGDGTIQADEFCQAQLQVAEVLGEMVHEDAVPTGLLPRASGRYAHGAAPPPPPPLSRSKTLSALQSAGFHDVDLDGDGMISYEEFRRWQLMLIGSSANSAATKRRHLAGLIRDLERQRRGADPSEAWAAAEARVIAAEGLPELEAAVQEAAALGLSVPAPRLALLEQLRAEELQRVRALHTAHLSGATGAAALAAALDAAASSLVASELQAFQERLEAMRRPFSVSVGSLSGAACAVEVTREQSVASLCQEVGSRLGKKAYRVRLAHAGGLLAPRTAALEECGVTGPEVELAASFGAADPLLELSVPEFLEAVVEHGLGTRQEADGLLGQHGAGELGEDTIRARFQAHLAQALEAAERRRREAEEARRLEVERRAAARAERRAPFEALGPAELEARAAAAGLAGRAEEGPSEARREVLVERLSLLAAAEALEAEAAALEAEHAALLSEVQRLADVAKQVREEAMRVLGVAMPALQKAHHALDGLRKDDLHLFRTLKKPPDAVVKVLEAVCRLFEIRPMVRANGEGRYVYEWFQAAESQLLRDSRLLDRMKHYDKDSIPEKVVRSIRPFIEDEACAPEPVGKLSVACSAFSAWVHAMYAYHKVSQEAQPHRLHLAALEAELGERTGELGALHQRQKERADAASGFRDELQLLDRS